MRLVLAALLVTLAGTAASGGGTFENRVYGQTLRLPAGWRAARACERDHERVHIPCPRLPRLLRAAARGAGADRALRLRTVALSARLAARGLGPRSRFEGYGAGYTVLLCQRGHSLQAFVKVGHEVTAARLAQARSVLASVRLTRRADEVASIHSVQVLGRSELGRPVRVWRIGNPRVRRRVLVIGCIHGNECAGTAVTSRLLALTRPLQVDLWVLPKLNPDGAALAVRQNGRGVDLDRNFGAMWKPTGRPGSAQYAGPRPWSERETRIARRLLLRLRPDVTIWFHQPQTLVRAWGQSKAAARRFAHRVGMPYRSLPWPNGTAANWQNHRFPGAVSFVVELVPGPLAPSDADRYVSAILAQ